MTTVLRKKRKGGFTLIELIVVIAILAILAVIAVPRFSGFTETSKIAADEQIAAVVANAALVYAASHNSAIPLMADLATGNYIEKAYAGTDLKSTKYKAGTPTITITAAAAPGTVTVTIGGSATYSITK